MLGPLEVVSDGQVIDLGGSKQRATLGFLLLQPNQVVPTSRLLNALWSVGEAPVTARKILQNAVWGLRRKLSPEEAGNGAVLRTQSPGYTLETDPGRIDLHCFRRMVEEGRAELAAGRPDDAALRLRQALGLWRGTVLSDLVEVGVVWPELTAVQNSRLDVLEDYFEAELDCGRHYTVLSEIEAVVDSEPLRERSCGQLMRALYRCGRQADALGVYSRLRSSLVEDLGLEPGRELQMLQQAILVHDPALQYVPPASPPVTVSSTAVPTTAVRTTAVPATAVSAAAVPATGFSTAVPTAAAVPTTPVPTPSVPTPSVPSAAGAGDTASTATASAATASAATVPAATASVVTVPPVTVPAPRAPRIPAALDVDGSARAAAVAVAGTPVRQEVSVLMLRTGLTAEACQGDDTDAALDRVDTRIRQEIESRGGTVVAAMGTDTLGVFPALPHTDGHAERAVCTALALRDAHAPGDIVIRAAVVTGEAFMRHRTDEEGVVLPPSVSGALLHECQAILALAPDGEVQVCSVTHEAVGHDCSCTRPSGAPGRRQWGHTLVDTGLPGPADLGEDTEYEGELDLLLSLMGHSARWRRQHQVYVLGSSDTARARFLADFRRIVAEDPHGAQVVVRRRPSAATDGRFGPHRAILSAYCGIHAEDDPRAVRGRLEATLRGLCADPGRARRLASRLWPLLDPAAARAGRGLATAQWLDGWYQFLEMATGQRPLVLILDGLHAADDALLDFVEALSDRARRLPVLVVGGAAPASLNRRASLAISHHCTTVIGMDARAGRVADRLLGPVGQPGLPSPARHAAPALTTGTSAGTAAGTGAGAANGTGTDLGRPVALRLSVA
ncbi:BTAD domain-containing putative transcriptional regulator [Streptomyces sp. NPDC014995]|uniref:BTAD domain-containing putative transcriptional regulator n=1 Tax=Streptomyces sp. NPDC014995 TaxID=3364936 RepID=UPI0036F50E4E